MTSWSSGSPSPPAKKEAGGLLLLQPMLVAHRRSPCRGCLQSELGCSALSPATRFVISVTVTHTHTAAASGLGPWDSDSLFLHAGLLRCCLLPAMGSDLSQCIRKDSAAVASMACMHSPSLMISFHPFKPPFKSHLVAVAWVFLSFWEILVEGFFYFFFYYEVSENVLVHFKYI